MELYLKYFGSKEDQRKDLTPYYFLQLKETREKLRKIGLFKPEDTFGEFLDTIGSKTFQDKVDMKRYDSPYYFLGRKKEDVSQKSSRHPSPERTDATDLGGAGMPPMMQQDNLEAQERRASQLVQEMYGNIFKGLNNASDNNEDDEDDHESSDNTSEDKMVRFKKN